MNGTKRDNRKDVVLAHIVEEHVSSAMPVSSRVVAERLGGGVSSATIRNVMSELEHQGLIEQPHTSAGRVPTNAGYRRYVSMKTEKVSYRKREADRLAFEYGLRIETIKELIEKTTHLISRELHNAGVMMWPGENNLYLKHLELVKIRSEVVLAVLITMTNAVKNHLVKLDRDISPEELVRVSRYVNENYSEKPVTETLEHIREEIKSDALTGRSDVRKVALTALRILDGIAMENIDNELYWEGIDNFMSEPEFSDISFMRRVFQIFSDQKKELADIFTRDLSSGDIKVYIGDECGVEILKDCSIVTCGYFLRGKAAGRMGVVGPTRMDYDRALRMVSCLSGLISAKLEEIDG
ncbi:MAG: heat-inducible transcriptional repressor HrcA [Candidatus Omnitrophota bacterium]